MRRWNLPVSVAVRPVPCVVPRGDFDEFFLDELPTGRWYAGDDLREFVLPPRRAKSISGSSARDRRHAADAADDCCAVQSFELGEAECRLAA